ncbi:MAG: nitrate- and nitrite sensing domain-containing protein [Dermatophilaceae bacterium]
MRGRIARNVTGIARIVKGVRPPVVAWRRLVDLPIRTRVALIMLVPMVALFALSTVQIAWGVRSTWAAGDTSRLAQLQGIAPELISALQDERTAAAVLLSDESPDPSVKQAFTERVAATEAKATVWNSQVEDADDATDSVRARIAVVEGELQRLTAVRSDVNEQRLDVGPISDQYSTVIGDLLGLGRLTTQSINDEALRRSIIATSAYGAFQEASAQEQTLLASALITGELGVREGVALIGSLNAQQSAFAEFAGSATTSQRAAAAAAASDEAVARVTQVEQQALRATRTGKIRGDVTQWLEASNSRLAAIRAVQQDQVLVVSQGAERLRGEATRSAVFNVLTVLFITLSALGVGLVIARSMVRPIRQLRVAALEAANHRLPEAVRAAQAGQRVLDDDVVRLRSSGRDEIGQLADAFVTIQDEAVRVASEQAIRRRETAVLVNTLARRSQSQVERAISRIDAMEQGETDADRLGEIFDLDHAVTRMRRTNESLMVLTREHTGADTPWDHPEPVRQVLQAALSEIEQYQRVEVTSADAVESGLVHPAAVKDVIHLLAELLENATTFSSRRTTVVAEARRVVDRLVIEIEDYGLGLSADQLKQINERLRKPPELDVAVARQMGLYVVARLAAIHGIDVALRRGGGGGVVAVVELPGSIVVWRPAPVTPGQSTWQLPAGLPLTAAGAAPRTGAAAPLAGVSPSQSTERAEESVPERPAPVFAERSEVPAVERPAPVFAERSEVPAVEWPEPARIVPGLLALSDLALVGTEVPTPTSDYRDNSLLPRPVSEPQAGLEDGLGSFGSPIFDDVKSHWFRSDGQVSAGHRPDQQAWVTAADAGWAQASRAATAAAAPVSAPVAVTGSDGLVGAVGGNEREPLSSDLGSYTTPRVQPVPSLEPVSTTPSGLPKRVPLANLVPGTVAPLTSTATPPSSGRVAKGETRPGHGGRPHSAVATTLRNFTSGADRARQAQEHSSADAPEENRVAVGRDHTRSQED